MVFVERENGAIVGVYSLMQPGYAEEELASDHPDVVAFVNRETDALPVLTMRQFRLGLLGAGLLGTVTAAIEAMPEPARSAALIEFDYASEVLRDNPLVLSLAAALNLSPEMIDDLWRSAAQL